MDQQQSQKSSISIDIIIQMGDNSQKELCNDVKVEINAQGDIYLLSVL